jgi:hypothetical protein
LIVNLSCLVTCQYDFLNRWHGQKTCLLGILLWLSVADCADWHIAGDRIGPA